MLDLFWCQYFFLYSFPWEVVCFNAASSLGTVCFQWGPLREAGELTCSLTWSCFLSLAMHLGCLARLEMLSDWRIGTTLCIFNRVQQRFSILCGQSHRLAGLFLLTPPSDLKNSVTWTFKVIVFRYLVTFSDMHSLGGLDSFTNVLTMNGKSPFASLYDFIYRVFWVWRGVNHFHRLSLATYRKNSNCPVLMVSMRASTRHSELGR